MSSSPPPPPPGGGSDDAPDEPPYGAAASPVPSGIDPIWLGASVPPPPATPASPYGAAIGTTNGKAIWSLVLGISSIVCCCLGLATGGVAILTGVVAQREIAVSGEAGDGIAKAGVITGSIGVALGVIFVVAVFTGQVHININTG